MMLNRLSSIFASLDDCRENVITWLADNNFLLKKKYPTLTYERNNFGVQFGGCVKEFPLSKKTRNTFAKEIHSFKLAKSSARVRWPDVDTCRVWKMHANQVTRIQRDASAHWILPSQGVLNRPHGPGEKSGSALLRAFLSRRMWKVTNVIHTVRLEISPRG